MTKAPKTAARQARRATRAAKREETRSQRRHQTHQTFEDRFTSPPAKPVTEPLVALTEAQADYGDLIEEKRITFGIGPAGTGKTYYATRLAAEALDRREIRKIYLTRPAVEAGESLGFLPGDLDEKYEPYLRPFKDALNDHFGAGHVEYLIKSKVIEPVPLGFLRGATIKNAWMLADEMQNATKSQMKMLLTRIGKDAKFIINGDLRQIDIDERSSGLEDAVKRTRKVEHVGAIEFTRADVVRDDIVQDILAVYDN
ncbi:PhoH family protein [Paracoccus litorisediminis]|uniref:AAA family ATPase n=1 Tax=Paracoccus litorisediminis TaxID=2006130 RepID=A0A844HLR5_9RHOB|nr:PhoH family protein [Paracoccus litorisediminis]MTH61223.1 AAA family ATPase [Paracoccus litorisediminis]